MLFKPSGRSRRFNWLCMLLPAFCLLLPEGAAAQKSGPVLTDSLIAAIPTASPDSVKARLLTVIGFRYSISEPARGAGYAMRGLQLAQRIGWERGIGNADNILGICAYVESDYPRALDYYSKATAIFSKIGDKQGLLKVINNVGNIYVAQSNYPAALENNFQALRYAEDLGDSVSIGISLNNIGSIYEYLKLYDKGLEYNFKALKLLQRLGDSAGIAVTLGNIGNLYSDKGKPADALRYHQQALAAHERLGDQASVARDLMNAGLALQELQQHAKATESFFRALEVVRQAEDRPLEANVLTCLGGAYVLLATDSVRRRPGAGIPPALAAAYGIPSSKSALLSDAIRYLRASIAIDSQLQNLNGLQNAYSRLATAQLMAGMPAAAYESNEKYHLYKDSLFSLESRLQVGNLETQRELSLKEKQIEINRLEVAKKRNERVFFITGIALLLAVGAILFRNIRLRNARRLSEGKLSAFQARMNPHFIFNSLNSIQSLVLNSETVPAITYLSRFSKLMRQILDSSAKSSVLLKTELEMLRGYIELEQLRFDRFRYELLVGPDISPEGTELPAMIIQPFVENAIIHGILPKEGEGLLTVSFFRNEKGLVCTIDDNGIGRKASAALNASRRKDHESQGIAIASSRLALLSKSAGSSVTYTDKETAGTATGTTVTLQIPIL